MNKKNRIAVLEGGTYFHHVSFNDKKVSDLIDKVIYLRDLRESDLEGIDTLLLLSRLNPDLLQIKKEIILQYKNNGNKLVVLAENNAQHWLYHDFRETEVNYWWWLEENADSGIRVQTPEHEMFQYMDESAVIWHYHGVFDMAENCVEIVRGRENGAILFETADGTLITTLDPDFHHGNYFMPGATLFWYGLLNYLAFRQQ